MQESDLRIFIGPARIGNIGSLLAGALIERGIRVTHAIHQISPERAESGMQYDILLDLVGPDSRRFSRLRRAIRYLCYFARFFLQHNTFIFLAGGSLLPYNMDLPILKLFRKKTVMWFVGSDIRHYESLAAAAQKAGIKHFVSSDRDAGPRALTGKLRMIRVVEKLVDYIISNPSYSQLLSRRYIMICVPQDICNIRYNNRPDNRTPMVVHAPSNPELKGTAHILEAVERLKGEGYEFEFRLFTKTSNTAVRESLSEADISVDQLFGLVPGMFAIESMAAGCAVLGSSYPDFGGFPPELPVIHTDADNVYQNLKMLLENPGLRQELGERGRRYVEKYHDHRKIADDFIRLITKGEADIIFDPRPGADDRRGKAPARTKPRHNLRS